MLSPVFTEDKSRALYDAAKRNDADAVQDIVGSGCDVDSAIMNDAGFVETALSAGARAGNKEVVGFLLIGLGANVNLGNPLHHALGNGEFEKGREEVAKILIEKGADINKASEDGEFIDDSEGQVIPLELAALNNYEEIAEELIDRDDLNLEHPGVEKALFHFIKHNNGLLLEQLFNKLIEAKGANPDLATRLLCHIFESYEERNTPNIVEYLLEVGANPNARMPDGISVLSKAIDSQYLGPHERVEVVTNLVCGGCLPVTEPEKKFVSNLVKAAVSTGSTAALEKILTAKNINNVDRTGRSWFHIAQENGQQKVIN